MTSPQLLPWDQWLDAAKENPQLAEVRLRLIAYARELATQPLLQRVYRLEDVGRVGRTWLDGRHRNGPPEVWETFALAMADCSMGGGLLEELPTIAAAARLTDDAGLRQRAVDQLREVATWSPLQRPGWTLFARDSKPFTDPKGDGNWLATGTGVIAIVQSLQILGKERVPADLWAQLAALLELEITSCLDDWETKRPWFYRFDNPFTNQWVLPTVGYLLASAFLGRETHRASYELGVKHLQRSLDAYGSEGSQVEGLGYATLTLTTLLHAARWLAVAGDDRLLSHPFLKNFPTWLVHHQQPGGFSINAFDQGGPPQFEIINGRRRSDISMLMGLCAQSGHRDARWATHCALTSAHGTFGSLVAKSALPPPEGYEPPRWAYYDATRRVNWRSSWDEATASGGWVRGCHPNDQHAHADHGHVNFIHRGRAILIEAGACVYHSPVGITHFWSAFGHNVLTLGELTPDTVDAATLKKNPRGFPKPTGEVPITVHRLDADGGQVMVEPGSSYQGALASWTRRVKWDVDQLEVDDEIVPAQPEFLNLRWHLGTREEPQVIGADRNWKISWPVAYLEIQASEPVEIRIERMSDHTLFGAKPDDQWRYPTHACVLVRTTTPVARAKVSLRAVGKV